MPHGFRIEQKAANDKYVRCKAVRVDSTKAVCSWHVLSVGLARALGRDTCMHCYSRGGGMLLFAGGIWQLKWNTF